MPAILNGYSGAGAAMMGTVVAVIVTCAVLFAISVLLYVFQSIGMYTIAKNRDVGLHGLAWVPVGFGYILGRTADIIRCNRGERDTRLRYKILFLTVASLVLYAVVSVMCADLGMSLALALAGCGSSLDSLVTWILILELVMFGCAVAASVFAYISLYNVYRSVTNSAGTLTVLSILFPVAIPFFLFCNRKRYMETIRLSEEEPVRRVGIYNYDEFDDYDEK